MRIKRDEIANEEMRIKRDEIANKYAASTDYNPELFEKMRVRRTELASGPSYVVFENNSLREMASRFPLTEEEFLEIKGVGTTRLKKYGSIFLRIIREHLQELGADSACSRVFPDSSLREMASRFPLTEKELLDITGVVPTNLRQYVVANLQIIREHLQEN